MTKINIQTKGMHCKSCEMLVCDSLNDLEGVNKSSASFKTGVIAVNFDSSKTSVEKIKEVIQKEGYKVL